MDESVDAPKIKLEICTGDPIGVRSAFEGGADRVELCSGLAEGGLTPSVSMMEYASRILPTYVLIRPRAGDFVYSKEEIGVMNRDIDLAIEAGASGIVIGALTNEGKVDKEKCRLLLRDRDGLAATFHRAFDLTIDPFEALEDIIELGFTRILTSGQASDALTGAPLISELKKRARGRILIVAGAGVTPENAAEIAIRSQADEIHASARSSVKSSMINTNHLAMGNSDSEDGSRMTTDPEKVAAIRKSLQDIN